MDRPGTYFTWHELTRSSKADELGIDNEPDDEQRAALVALVQNVLDPFRQWLGQAVRVTSGLRTLPLNRAVGSWDTSQHVTGEAVDCKSKGYTGESLARELLAANIEFDQLIWYCPERGGHIHVSFTTKRENRRELRYAPASGGYPLWDPDARL